jgi:hypothetical protein
MISAEEKTRALNWLYDAGNPVLKLWAAERLSIPADELERLRTVMLQYPTVQYWLDCLLSLAEKPALHNSFDTCMENSMRKVLLLGIREADDPRLTALNNQVLERLAYQLEHPYWLNPVEYTIMASYLAAMGHNEQPVLDAIRERLDSSLEFKTLGGCDMHVDPEGYPTIPAARRKYPLIHPKYNDGNRYRFPLVYDLFSYANLPSPLACDSATAREINEVIDIVLDERYQRLPWGYGLIFVPPNKYYGMGWSVHLPKFFEEENNRVPDAGSVWWAEAMARYPAAARSDWFRRMMEHLEGFSTKDGFWKFPAAYLAEGPDHYFVGGGHMGLGENRKEKDALKVESTAWMMRILENIQP